MNYQSGYSVSEHSLSDLFPTSLFKSPAVSIRLTNTIGEAALLLSHCLESFTDSLVIVKEAEPSGVLGGIELLEGLMENPTSDFFDNATVDQKMSNKITIVSKETKLRDLIKQWQETRRAFAIIQNQYSGYSAISARKILEIANSYETSMTISKIPKKNMVTFDNNFTVKDIINLMFENKTRKLVLKGTTSFISDRIIIEKIVRDLNLLHNVKDFLNMNCSMFRLENAKTTSEDSSIQDASKIMYDMLSPYLIVNDRVISPWDIVLSLGSAKLS